MTADADQLAQDLTEVEIFLYREADLLDAADLDGWLELYTEDGTYWMPSSPEQENPDTEISIIYDDRLLMELRRRNFGDEWSASMDYDVRSSHLIGNVRLAPAVESTDHCRALSNFQAAIYYRGRTTFFAGRYTHDLVRDTNDLRIRHKRVDLINCDSAELRSLIIYL